MTEKRFSVDNHCNLFDDEYNVFYPIEGSRENIELLCRRLNNLKEENEQLKKTNQGLYDELQETMGYLSLKTGVEKENEQLKKELSSYQEIHFRNDDGTQCILYERRTE